jgi:hypothetical protein
MFAAAILVVGFAWGCHVLAGGLRALGEALSRPRDVKAAERALRPHATELRREIVGEAKAFVADREQRLSRLEQALASRLPPLEADLKARQDRKLKRVG